VKLLQASVESKHNNCSFRKLRHGNSKRENNLIILQRTCIITIVSGRSDVIIHHNGLHISSYSIRFIVWDLNFLRHTHTSVG
jgi:hypothetical protein